MSVVLSAVLWYILTRSPSSFEAERDMPLQLSPCSARLRPANKIIAAAPTLALPNINAGYTISGQDKVITEKRRDRIMKTMVALWKVLETRGLAQDSLAPFIGEVMASHSGEENEQATVEVNEMKECMAKAGFMHQENLLSPVKSKL